MAPADWARRGQTWNVELDPNLWPGVDEPWWTWPQISFRHARPRSELYRARRQHDVHDDSRGWLADVVRARVRAHRARDRGALRDGAVGAPARAGARLRADHRAGLDPGGGRRPGRGRPQRAGELGADEDDQRAAAAPPPAGLRRMHGARDHGLLDGDAGGAALRPRPRARQPEC